MIRTESEKMLTTLSKTKYSLSQRNIRLFCTSILSFLIWLCVLASPAFVNAQSDQSNVKFTQGSFNDSGSLSLGVSLGDYKGRGLDLPITLNYSSDIWKIEHLGTVQTTPPGYSCCITQSVTKANYAKDSSSGWRSSLTLPFIEFPKTTTEYDYKGKSVAIQGGGNCFIYRIREVYIHMPDGSTHTLRQNDQPSNNPNSVVMSGIFYAVDESRIRFDANSSADTGTIYMPDGTRYVIGHPTSSITDRNGNTMTYNETTQEWTDTLGRKIINPLLATPLVGDFDYFLPGLPGVNNGQIKYTLKWKNLQNALTPKADGTSPAMRVIGSEILPYPDSLPSSSNFPQSQTSSYEPLFKSTPLAYTESGVRVGTLIVGRGQTVPGGQLFNPVVLTEIVLPNGTSYKFNYNVYGEIDKVVYPTNAYDKYEYTGPSAATAPPEGEEEDLQPYIQALRTLTSRKLSVDGTGNDIKEWTYTVNKDLDGGGSTTVINPDKTRTLNVKYGAGPKTAATTGSGGQSIVMIYPFGFKDARVGMTAYKKFYSSSTDGLGGDLLRYEIYQYDQTTQNYSIGCTLGSTGISKTFPLNRTPRLTRTTNIIFESGNNKALAQSNTFDYDLTNQMTTGIDQTSVSTYNYAVVDTTTAQAGIISQIPIGALASTVTTTYQNNTAYQSRNILGLPLSVTLSDSTGIKSKAETSYDDFALSTGSASNWQDPQTTVRGNTTKAHAYYDVANSQYIETQKHYDQFGNPVSLTDGRGNTTITVYETTYYAFPYTVTTPAPGLNGSSTGFTTTFNYNATTGLLLSSTDANNQTTQMEYDGALRPTKVTAPNGEQSITEYGVPDSTTHQLDASQRFVKIKTQIDSVNWKQGYTWFDGIGRTTKTQSVNSKGDVFVETQYDSMGRVWKTSNPYRSGEAVYWTTNNYDDLGRVINVTTPDGAHSDSAYSLGTGTNVGNVITITDQALKQRRSITNALGQLVRVDEPIATDLGTIDSPNQSTNYSYDTLSNLKTVQQIGTNTAQCGGTLTSCTQTRSFVYDSLSRLTSATNPEMGTTATNGTISYNYDYNGNLINKTDPKSVTTTYTYDNLNRISQRSYSDSVTPQVNYYYDNLTNAKGKLTKVVTGNTATPFSVTDYQSFDVLGRVTGSQQTTDGIAYPAQIYTYNLSGALIEEKYPSGRVVKKVLDNNGDLSIVQSKKNTNAGYWTYAEHFTYTSAGALSSMQLGNGKWESTQFNNRLQPKQIALGTTQGGTDKLKLDYQYGKLDASGQTIDGTNNGNISKQTITVPTTGQANGFTAVQYYAYDELNRIKQASETITPNGQALYNSWTQTYLYDRYGNRRFDTTGGNTTTLGSCPQAQCNPTIDPTKNQFTTGQGYTYDLAGNVKTDAQGKTFNYDGENKQTSVTSSGTPLGTYFYDGDGKRVKKVVGTETTVFVYDAGGKMVAEYATTLSTTPQVSYLTSDHLGSPRINTDANGNIITRHDYMPFGEEINSTTTAQRNINLNYAADDVRQKFTVYERDSETDLDFAQARYYSKNLGRFHSTDPLNIIFEKEGGKDKEEQERILIRYISDGQNWNRYVYVTNNPLKFIDPTGLERYDSSVSPSEQKSIHDALLYVAANGTTKQRRIANAIIASNLTFSTAPAASIGGASGSTGVRNAADTQNAINTIRINEKEALDYLQITIAKETITGGGPEGVQGTIVHETRHAWHDAMAISSFSWADQRPIYNATYFVTEYACRTAYAEWAIKLGKTKTTNEALTMGVIVPNKNRGYSVSDTGIRKVIAAEYSGMSEQQQGLTFSAMSGVGMRRTH